jgi:hypothetical protein
MKLTSTHLRRIIKEEVRRARRLALSEAMPPITSMSDIDEPDEIDHNEIESSAAQLESLLDELVEFAVAKGYNKAWIIRELEHRKDFD